ncbi:TPA: hypothetical protein PI908_002304 [Staphylococcus aureus]|nr:hypothetical protein [Staphylococcus aureus]HDH6611532.1 hypothetical protein [Staphylococcus aureus]HDH6642996.1 hypothetical protein [Staphylococcus aureus]HDH6645518.1 hypothetical protein [Staphylococcus aureus]HDH6648015.1 hypothetical protein [Staphylococcus aureus]
MLSEIEAANKFNLEQKKINLLKRKNKEVPEGIFGLTYDRYISIYKSLEQNKADFENKLKQVGEKHPDLKEFDYSQQEEANKIIMIGRTLTKKVDAVQNMYNKLDVVVEISYDDRAHNTPRNNRMLEKMKEDLETIIDEFFEEAELARPNYIPILTESNGDNKEIRSKLRKDANDAKSDPRLVDPGVKIRAEKAKNVEEYFKTIKGKGSEKKYDDEYEAIRKRAIEKINSNINGSVASLDYDEDSKKESKQKSKRKADQELQQINNLSHIEKVINNTVKYEPKPHFNSNIVDTKNNISGYNDGSVKYSPRPQFNSNVVSTKNNITEYSNGSVKYGPRPQMKINIYSMLIYLFVRKIKLLIFG